MDIYLAGPLFGISDEIRNLRLGNALALRGYDMILPQQRALKFSKDGKPDIKAICVDCKRQAMMCDVIVANIDGPDADSGTAMEVGIALASPMKPITICVRTDFRTSLENEVGINGMFQLVDEVIYMPAYVSSLNDEESFYLGLAEEIDKAIHRAQYKRQE